jgi:hypothetical protein
VEQFLALYALMGFLDLLGLLVCFLPLFLTLQFGMEDYRLVVYREVTSIPEELLQGQDGFFLFSFLVVWLRNLVFNKPFCSQQKLNDHTHTPPQACQYETTFHLPSYIYMVGFSCACAHG